MHDGFVFSHTGDGVVAAFASPKSAVDAAIAAQQALELSVRMGIATGEAELRDGDYFGTVRASIAVRSTSSCASRAARIASASDSHRRVDPSTSVNRNVTTPEGAAAPAADTHAESHTRPAATWHIGGIRPNHPRPEARHSGYPLAGSRPPIWHMLAGQR